MKRFLVVSMIFASPLVYAMDKADCEGLYKDVPADKALCGTYNAAVDAFNARTTTSKFDGQLATLAGIEGKAQDADLNYDVQIVQSRMAYWQGQHTTDVEARKAIHLNGYQKALAATKASDDYAEGFYFAGINLARWAEANGIMASLGRKAELEKDMKDANDRTTRTGEDGASVDGYGPNRTLGRMHYKLKILPGYSLEQSIRYLTTAVTKSNPPNALNVVYLADSLLKGNSADKASARKMLTDLVAQDVNAYNPSRIPETTEEFQLARDLLNGKELP